jgi:2-oxoglutarate/2-oxoacid ferredoxin oxidoreductase subunit beta
VAIDEEIDRALNEESPGPSELDSALANDTLADVLSHGPLILDPESSLSEALRVMREHRRGYVLLVKNGNLEGIFTERDVLLKIAGASIDTESKPVSEYMTRDPITLPADAGVAFALHKMVVEGFRHLPLVDEHGRPVGVVSMRDIIEYLSDFFRREVLNLPPDPRVATKKRDGA